MRISDAAKRRWKEKKGEAGMGAHHLELLHVSSPEYLVQSHDEEVGVDWVGTKRSGEKRMGQSTKENGVFTRLFPPKEGSTREENFCSLNNTQQQIPISSSDHHTPTTKKI